MSETIFHPAIIEMLDANIVALRDVSFAVLENVNWSVLPGEFWVVAGQSHSGKSDLLLHAAGLMTPSRGTCRLFGDDTKAFEETQIAERLRAGFVFADARLFSQMTIAENVALPLRYHKNLTDTESARAVELLLELLELAPFADATPGNVAVNWRQRAALARALVLKPELLLLDDPLAGLGARHRQWLLNLLEQLWRGHEFFGGRPMTIVATTDDLRAWRHPQRKFAALHEGNFFALGAWDDENFTRHQAVKDLLSAPQETNI
jgi:ABC-type transporter Mla maintaining outer membrane lipid asymmetry ATPase subunit MlaF